jgi:hypothetical protein
MPESTQPTSPTQPASPAQPATQQSSPAVEKKIRLAEDEINFESIKNSIYLQTGLLHEAQLPAKTLRLGKDLYEILNRRLVFRTPAHKELPHFITPFGSLRVQHVNGSELEDDAFVVE